MNFIGRQYSSVCGELSLEHEANAIILPWDDSISFSKMANSWISC